MELFGLNRAELSSLCEQLGQSSFRGKQIAEWLYKKAARDVAAMTSLPAALRETLAREHTLTRSEVLVESRDPDGTAKYLLGLSDGQTIETVLLPYEERTSVCVSTQVGCPAGCAFCATGRSGYVRNLTAGEIVDQVLTLQEKGCRRITHVVFMGMGEPLLNFDNVVEALHLLNDEVGIGMRHMTVSTVGIPATIQKLRELDLQITLAISLHAPDQSLRQAIIPMAARYPLDQLLQTCRDYANATKRRITFEYLLLAGVNDSPDQAAELVRILRHTLCNVNLIPFNEVPGLAYKRPNRAAVQAFRAVLEEAGIEVTQRMERGHTIAAACGQLRRRHAKS